MNRRILTLIAVLATLALALPLAAQFRWTSWFADTILDGDGHEYSYTLVAGTYQVWAEGDSSWGDLDVRVYDSRGRLIARDTLTDNYPIATFTLPQTTSIRVVFSEHGTSQGYYGEINQF